MNISLRFRDWLWRYELFNYDCTDSVHFIIWGYV